MEFRIVPLNSFKQFSDLNLRIEFLMNFPFQCILRTFPTLNLSAREFPPALPLAITSLCGKHFPITDYDCCDNFYCLRIYKFSSK